MLDVSNENTEFNVLDNIKKHIEKLKGYIGSVNLLCLGEYAIKTVAKWPFLEKTRRIFPVFIGRSLEEIKGWIGLNLDSQNIMEIGTGNKMHFWFNVLSEIKNNDEFIERLKEKSVHKREKSILAASVWDGDSSGLLPFLLSKLKEWETDAISIAVLPSIFQSSDDHFNAVSSIGLSLAESAIPILLMDRENLENYVGVDRRGEILKGNAVIHYLLELILSKESFIRELNELSEIFSVNNYTALLASGASLRIYGSLRNIFKSLLFRPLLTFNFSSSTIGYILLRIPAGMEGKVTKEKVEREFSGWFEGKASFSSLEVSDPIFINERNDRVDIAVFLGGFGKSETFAQMSKKSADMARNAILRGFIERNEWEKILKSLDCLS
ncbi:hypothetical protein CW705_06390 [Candidatus Bathyarchaeota archaeon]|nr:MAG: hypothetical protein CW705_06390 [Candidatus Bathyarchaeota archaeon]